MARVGSARGTALRIDANKKERRTDEPTGAP
jgi:hypothetical protein